MSRPLPPHAGWSLWRWPVALGLLSASGLLTALVSDGWGDVWSWVGLGLPVVVAGVCAWPRRGARQPSPEAQTDASCA